MTAGGKTILVAGALLAVYVAAGPYITVHQIRSAVANHDGEALSEQIDFPSVRQSFKDQMNAMLMSGMTKKGMKNDPYAPLSAAFAGVIVDKMVDAYITPAGLTSLMSGESPTDTADTGSNGKAMCKPFSDSSMSYESLDKFVLKTTDDNGNVCEAVLRRRGIGWKLTEIIFPVRQ